MQDYLKGLEEFKTTFEGLEFQCFMRYYPAEYGWSYEPSYPESAEVEYILFAGADLTWHLHDGLKAQVVERFLEKVRAEKDANY